MSFEFLKLHAEALLLMLVAASLGGVAQYVSRVKMRKGRFSIFELAGEMVISAAGGMTAGLLVMDYAPLPLTFAIASVGGHMGTRFMFAMERSINARINAGRADDTPGARISDGPA